MPYADMLPPNKKRICHMPYICTIITLLLISDVIIFIKIEGYLKKKPSINANCPIGFVMMCFTCYYIMCLVIVVGLKLFVCMT